jgi:hypothetical protein
MASLPACSSTRLLAPVIYRAIKSSGQNQVYQLVIPSGLASDSNRFQTYITPMNSKVTRPHWER